MINHDEMKVNKSLSKELQYKNNHKVGKCYENSWNMLQKKGLQQHIGYVKNGSHWFRHGWNTKDGEIIDTSLANTEGNYKYYTLFTISTQEDIGRALKTSNKKMLEWDLDLELDFVLNNIEDCLIVMVGDIGNYLLYSYAIEKGRMKAPSILKV